MSAMRTWILLLLFPWVLAAQTGSPAKSSQQAATPTPTPTPNQTQEQEGSEPWRADVEEAVKHMLVSQIEAWNHRQLQGFMQGYWRSPDLTFYSGATVTKGWEPTLERYR